MARWFMTMNWKSATLSPLMSARTLTPLLITSYLSSPAEPLKLAAPMNWKA